MEKCYIHLSAVEREEISRGMATGSPIRSLQGVTFARHSPAWR